VTVSLLDRTAADLLEAFAAGTNVPGAGSAAALSGAVAGSLLQAAARYAIKAAGRGRGSDFLEKAEALLESARERSRRLSLAVDEDAAAFEQYWRDRTDEALRPAIDVPLGIAHECLALAEIGLELYDRGSRNARGEAATAVLNAVASGEAAVSIARFNLRAARDPSWLDSPKERIIALGRGLDELRREIRVRLEGDGR
jgi:methenyltetrahydrofolate cyclohydrolase